MRLLSFGRNLDDELALKHRAQKCWFVAGLDSDAVGDERAVETCGKLRREIARAIRMRQDNVCRRQVADHLLERSGVAIRGIRLESSRIDHMDSGDSCLADLPCGISWVRTEHDYLDRLIAAELLRRGHGFPRGAMQLAS